MGGKRLTQKEIIRRFIKKHGNKYDYSNVKFKTVRDKIEIICNGCGNIFPQRVDTHLAGGGCKKCAAKRRADKFRKGEEVFIKNSQKVHGFRYDYSKVVYINAETEVEIICPEHGPFWQKPGIHINSGSDCPDCAAIRSARVGKEENQRARDSFADKANIKHDFKYDYSNVIYIDNDTDVEIICPKHGSFKQRPRIHLSGNGCLMCGRESRLESWSRTSESFKKDSNKVHNNFYCYDNVIFKGVNADVEIICPKHGPFPQRPYNHLAGHGCPKCNFCVSKPETEWLDSLNIPNDKEHRNVRIKLKDRHFNVDGFDPETKTIFEFDGDFWHGNPDVFTAEDINRCNKETFGELYQKTLEKAAILKQAGYNVISIWESDFKKQPNL